MFQLSCFPQLKSTSLIIMQTNYFHSWAKLPFCCHQQYHSASWGSIQLAVKNSSPKIPWNDEAGRLISFSNRFEIWHADPQYTSRFACSVSEPSEYFQYQYGTFDTSRDLRPNLFKPLTLRSAERKNGSRIHSRGPAVDTWLASVPPTPRRSGNTQHENTVTPKSALHCRDRSA